MGQALLYMEYCYITYITSTNSGIYTGKISRGCEDMKKQMLPKPKNAFLQVVHELFPEDYL